MSVRANRAFLARVVRFLAAEAGIRQFLDSGTGIPAANNTHEVAQSVAPDSRVLHVDYDRCKWGCAHAGITFPPFAWCRAVVSSSCPARYVPTRARVGRRDDHTRSPGCVG
jgi:S-adenosyl methyltransferase